MYPAFGLLHVPWWLCAWEGVNLRRNRELVDDYEVSRVYRIRLKKSEWALLDASAAVGRMGSTRAKPSVPAIMASCVRGFWTCLAYHAQADDYEPQAISLEEAIESGLTVPGISRRRNTLYREEEE